MLERALPSKEHPFFSQKGRPFEKYHVKGALIWELHKKKIYNTANLPYSAIFFCK